MIYHNSPKTEAEAVRDSDVPVRVGDVARMLQVAAHTLRFWEKEFGFYLKPSRTAGLQRRYNNDTIDRLKKIQHYLKGEGYSIAGTKRILSSMVA
ncbi:MAG: MerR family transcriptional regulator [Fibromonadaceae bacterium]|jgi:DNA-binding transcriptional MerR regulator|nr:MerR family transcriptional regulator [Fibromonadaceae bacterium]